MTITYLMGEFSRVSLSVTAILLSRAQSTPHPPRAHCEIVGDTGVNIVKEGDGVEAIVLSARCSFERGGLMSAQVR